MEQVILPGSRPIDGRADDVPLSSRSAASWPAIFAGAFVTISVTLVLIALGSGLGFASISPWAGHGVSATTFTVTAAIWLIVTQWLSAALGGYMAGRLRTKWVGTHTHEVFFRDTAHGFVTWSVATVVVFAVLAGSATSMLGGGMHALSAAAGSTGGSPMTSQPTSSAIPPEPAAALTYDIDKLFRPATETASSGSGGPNANGPAMTGPAMTASPGAASPGPGGSAPEGIATGSDPRVEAVYIAFHAMATGSVPDSDRAYLTERVSAETGATPAQAQQRVAETSIYLALSMLIGAFIASVSAALGGRLRDEHP
jgi:hypothetical protein